MLLSQHPNVVSAQVGLEVDVGSVAGVFVGALVGLSDQ